MSATKSQTKGASMGPLRANPCQKGRTTAMFEEKTQHLGISGFLPSAAVSYSDHP